MQATMTVRTDALVKARFTALCDELGMSFNTAVNVFMKAALETGGIPFFIGKAKDYKGEKLVNLLEKNRQAMIERDEPEMTLEEINAEIAAYRAERRAKRQQETAL